MRRMRFLWILKGRKQVSKFINLKLFYFRRDAILIMKGTLCV